MIKPYLGALRGVLGAAALVAAAGSAAATPINLLSNGSFESTSQANGTWSIQTGYVDGWATGSKGLEVRNNVAGQAFDGLNFIELDTTGNSWISQTFESVIGQHYQLSFYYSPRAGVDAESNMIQALINGTSVAQLKGSGINALGNVWQHYSYDFVAAGDLSTIGFKALGASDSYGGSLDAVSVTAVPEPASWATMLVGLLGLGLISRRRSR
jgi:hypothetical protein